MRFALSLLVTLLLMACAEPLAAQVPEFPTDCTEAMSAGNIFIGHDCGEWASVLISGNILIRKPWSRANRANRGARLRLRREGGTAATSTVPARAPAPAPAPEPASMTQCHPDYVECLPIVDDINCGDPRIPGGTVELYDPDNDDYELDTKSGPGDGIGCNG